jgi:hypothetical protein
VKMGLTEVGDTEGDSMVYKVKCVRDQQINF